MPKNLYTLSKKSFTTEETLKAIDCNLIVSIVEVNATKTVSINQLVQQTISPGERVLIWPFLLVQGPIVYADPKGTIFLASKKSQGPIKRGARPDPALTKVLIQLFPDLSKFYRWHSILHLSI